MSRETAIQWADSTLNLQMGCGGCELWKPGIGIRRCYAGVMIEGEGNRPGMKGRKGWPARFQEPTLFLDRLDAALRWPDLTGRERPGKLWLNGMPRLIFLNDMGDTFTAELPLDWLAPLLPRMADSPHQFLVLTKRPSRMAAFSKRHPFPRNFWCGTTVTDNRTAARIRQLHDVDCEGPTFVSFEPLWGRVQPDFFGWEKCCGCEEHLAQGELCEHCNGTLNLRSFDWAIIGGESGPSAFPFYLRELRELLIRCREFNIRRFVKQLGANPLESSFDAEEGWSHAPLSLRDSHGGDWDEWPDELRVRQMPRLA